LGGNVGNGVSARRNDEGARAAGRPSWDRPLRIRVDLEQHVVDRPKLHAFPLLRLARPRLQGQTGPSVIRLSPLSASWVMITRQSLSTWPLPRCTWRHYRSGSTRSSSAVSSAKWRVSSLVRRSSRATTRAIELEYAVAKVLEVLVPSRVIPFFPESSQGGLPHSPAQPNGTGVGIPHALETQHSGLRQVAKFVIKVVYPSRRRIHGVRIQELPVYYEVLLKIF
jgi:hypothetical protein